jgi:hypothetical protein
VNNRYYIRPLGVRGRQPFISNVNLAMRNPHVRGGISGVRAEDFGRGNVRVARLDLKDGDLRDSRMVRGNLPVVPTRESLRPGRGDEPVRMSTQPKMVDRFYTRHQPPAALPSFHDQVNRVQQVVAHTEPARVPMQGGSGGQDRSFHTQPTMVGRDAGANDRSFHTQPATIGRDAGANGGFHTQPATVNRVDGGNRESSADRPNREENSGDRNGWRGFGGGREEASASGPQQQETGGAKPGPERNGNASPTPERNDHTGWTKFSPRPDRSDAGRGQQPGAGNSDNRGPRMDRSGQGQSPRQDNSSGEDRTGFHRFPSGQDRGPQQDRSVQPSPSPRGSDGGGWQHFPANGDRGSRGNDSSERGNGRPSGKPRLDLDKPIVTPRADRGSDRGPSGMPDVHERPGNFPSPSPSRGPEIHDRPGNFPSPSPSRMPEIRGGGDRGGSREMPSGGRSQGGNERSGGDRGGDKGGRNNSGPHYR